MNLTVSVKRLTSKKASSGRMKHFWLLSFLRHACSSVKYHCWFSFSPSSASRGLLVGWVCSRLVIILPQAYIKLETSLRSLPADADFWHDPTEEFEPQLWFWIHHPLSYLSISSFHSRVFITAWTLKIWLQALQLQLGCDLYSGGENYRWVCQILHEIQQGNNLLPWRTALRTSFLTDGQSRMCILGESFSGCETCLTFS